MAAGVAVTRLPRRSRARLQLACQVALHAHSGSMMAANECSGDDPDGAGAPPSRRTHWPARPGELPSDTRAGWRLTARAWRRDRLYAIGGLQWEDGTQLPRGDTLIAYVIALQALARAAIERSAA